MEMLKLDTGLMITNVPYKGSGPALIDLMAGHIHAGFFNSVATIPYVLSGRLRGLMISGMKRSQRVPNVPTGRELGLSGFDENAAYMIMVPSATPPDVIARLNKELVRALHTPELKSRFAAEGAEIIGSSHEEAVSRQNREIEEWAELIRRTGIKLN